MLFYVSYHIGTFSFFRAKEKTVFTVFLFLVF